MAASPQPFSSPVCRFAVGPLEAGEARRAFDRQVAEVVAGLRVEAGGLVLVRIGRRVPVGRVRGRRHGPPGPVGRAGHVAGDHPLAGLVGHVVAAVARPEPEARDRPRGEREVHRRRVELPAERLLLQRRQAVGGRPGRREDRRVDRVREERRVLRPGAERHVGDDPRLERELEHGPERDARGLVVGRRAEARLRRARPGRRSTCRRGRSPGTGCR